MRAILGAFWVIFLAGAALAQGELCKDPAAYCRSQSSSGCLSRSGAGAGPANTESAENCEQELRIYRDCLAMAVEKCGAGPIVRGHEDVDPGKSLAAAASIALPYTGRALIGTPDKQHYYDFELTTGCFAAFMIENQANIAFSVLTLSGDSVYDWSSNSILGKRSGQRMVGPLPKGRYVFQVRTRVSQPYRLELSELPSC